MPKLMGLLIKYASQGLIPLAGLAWLVSMLKPTQDMGNIYTDDWYDEGQIGIAFCLSLFFQLYLRVSLYPLKPKGHSP